MAGKLKTIFNESAVWIAGLIFGAFFLLMSFFVWQNSKDTFEQNERCNETTEGIVTAVEQEEHIEKRDKSDPRSKDKVYYTYKTSYTYTVGEREYSGTITLSEYNKHAEGSLFVVYYNSDMPYEHYTSYENRVTYSSENGVPIGAILLGLLGIGIVVLNIYCWVKDVRDTINEANGKAVEKNGGKDEI